MGREILEAPLESDGRLAQELNDFTPFCLSGGTLRQGSRLLQFSLGARWLWGARRVATMSEFRIDVPLNGRNSPW